LIVAPAVTARMLGRSLNAMFAIAVASGLMAGVAGLLLSYHAGLPTGPTVALLAVAQVGVVALWAHPARAVQRSLISDRASAAAH
jgi:ABC-type Mn2+/Zn2+ transport system permease subunit